MFYFGLGIGLFIGVPLGIFIAFLFAMAKETIRSITI